MIPDCQSTTQAGDVAPTSFSKICSISHFGLGEVPVAESAEYCLHEKTLCSYFKS